MMQMFTKKFLKLFDGIEEDILVRVLFEMNRFYDVRLKDYYATFKKNYGRVLDWINMEVKRLFNLLSLKLKKWISMMQKR